VRYNQFIISSSASYFAGRLADNYNLSDVTDRESGLYNPEAPCLFAGMYLDDDYNNLIDHPGQAKVIWFGSDVLLNKRLTYLYRTRPHIKHVVLSTMQSKWFNALGIPHKEIPLTLTCSNKWKSEELGSKVFMYAPDDRYGLKYANRIQDESGTEVLLLKDPKQYNTDEMYAIYKDCFIGVRLTEMDGNANVVTEMGLMGRKHIWNGRSAAHIINYEEVYDSVPIIINEKRKIGKRQDWLARTVQENLILGSEVFDD